MSAVPLTPELGCIEGASCSRAPTSSAAKSSQHTCPTRLLRTLPGEQQTANTRTSTHPTQDWPSLGMRLAAQGKPCDSQHPASWSWAVGQASTRKLSSSGTKDLNLENNSRNISHFLPSPEPMTTSPNSQHLILPMPSDITLMLLAPVRKAERVAGYP